MIRSRIILLVFFVSLFLILSACGTPNTDISTEPNESSRNGYVMESTEESVLYTASHYSTDNNNESGDYTDPIINIRVGDYLLTATLVDNSSTERLIELLSKGSITVDMKDYANMEKVGPLPEALPRNDEQINTDAGDLILYQGISFVIYYDTNSWSLTRLGKINDITRQELREILGQGDVTVVLSLPLTN